MNTLFTFLMVLFLYGSINPTHCTSVIPAEESSSAAPVEKPSTTSSYEVPLPVATHLPIHDFIDYLRKRLPTDTYANCHALGDSIAVIWYVDLMQVERAVEQYGSNELPVIYKPAKFPLSTLQPIYNEVADLPVIKDNAYICGITGDGIEISVERSYASLLEWLKTYEHKEYVYLKTTYNGQMLYADTVPPVWPDGVAPKEDDSARTTQHEVLLYNYLTEYLSPEDYNSITFSSDTSVQIYCTNEEKVRILAETYKDYPYEIIYLKAKYSLALLQPICDELEKTDNPIIPSPWIEHDGVHLSAAKTDPTIDEFYMWLASYAHKEYIVVDLLEGIYPN